MTLGNEKVRSSRTFSSPWMEPREPNLVIQGLEQVRGVITMVCSERNVAQARREISQEDW